MEDHIKVALLIATRTLLNKDSYLIQISAHERSISTKLMSYLVPLFPDHDVDHEYDKHQENPKLITDGSQRAEMPDIIVHSRGNDGNNLIAMEIKSKEQNDASDKEKLVSLTRQDGNYRYKYGLHIKFSNNPEVRVSAFDVYIDGQINTVETSELKEFLNNNGTPIQD